MRMRMELELFSEAELEKMLQDALKVWREVPFRVQGTEEFFDYLIDYGCTVDGELVRFPQVVVDKVMGRIAERKQQWLERGGDRDRWPPSGLEVFAHGQGLHICDLETNELRLATEADLVTWCHAVDALGVEERAHPTFIPTDVPRGSAEFHAFATIILNSRKPHRVSVYSVKMLPLFIEACRIAKGSMDAVKQTPEFATRCWVNSPFMITRENIEVAMEARRLLGTPISFGHMPVAGAAVPITVAGALVQNTAESLALSAMQLAIDDTTHAITGTSATIDMRDLCHRPAGPDMFLHQLAGSEMHAYLFGGKAAASFRSVSAQTVSPQSMSEKMLHAAFGIASGLRKIGIGCLGVSDLGSPVQLVLDFEMVRFFNEMFRDVSTDEAHIGLETILQTAPRGAYFMETEHTARFFREECWLAAFSDYRPPSAWMQSPTDMVDRARDRARELFGTAENQCPLSEDEQRQVRELIAEADALAGGQLTQTADTLAASAQAGGT